ncbi:MAG: hypothetical protein ACTHMT_08400 [Verrucomicrobiota bacterium]
MKYLLLAFLLCSTHGAIFEMEFKGVKMSGANVVPNPVETTGTGKDNTRIGQPGIIYHSYDDKPFLLLGFTFEKLVGGFERIEIHGPADENSTGPLLYDITNLSFRYSKLGNTYGGIYENGIHLIPNPNGSPYDIPTQESQLVSGLWYITISTSFADPEIRGQLVPIPEPQTYGLIGGIALAGFATFRKLKTSKR